ncbi:MAG: DUF2797 domain-containing protein [Bacteroidota bacterium]|nr:DUF2797 domain-containing protein [Bacteroidota bacterium]
MKFDFTLTKMQTEFTNPIKYYLVGEGMFLYMNDLLNKKITIEHVGYECLNCKMPKKIFRQGACFDCFNTAPQVADWILKPELSKAHLDIEDRDLEYEKKVQLQPHIVYLALSSHIKVGVTRKTQVPYRWIDQGASRAVPILETPNRYLAGLAEVSLKQHYSDKTNYKKMLQPINPNQEAFESMNKLSEVLPEELSSYIITQNEFVDIYYPVLSYPEKPTSLKLDDFTTYSGVLKGIKGQYLLFDDQTVWNVRGSEGYKVQISID